VPKIKTLLIATWLIVPAGAAGSLAVLMYLAPPLIQLFGIQEPAEPVADAPAVVDEPPPWTPPQFKTQLSMDISVDREIVEGKEIIERYSGTFWRLNSKPDQNDISYLADWLTSMPTGGVLYVDDHGRYSEDISVIRKRHIVIRRHEPRWPCREQILRDLRDAIEAFLKQEKLKRPPDGEQIPS
jgi:hypothetical protein